MFGGLGKSVHTSVNAARRSACATVLMVLCSLPLAATPPAQQMTLDEAEALIDAGKYVKVLDYALDAVKRDPESFEANFLLGLTLHKGEGNLPLAQYRLEKAKTIAMARGGY